MTYSIPSEGDVASMTPNQYKTYENRLRRTAERQGLLMQKARRRDSRAIDWNTYQLVDSIRNTVVASRLPSGFGMTLVDVDRELNPSVAKWADKVFSDDIYVDYAPQHECATFADSSGQPILAYENGRGWVLTTSDGDHYVTGETSLDPTAAIDSAREYMHGLASADQ